MAGKKKRKTKHRPRPPASRPAPKRESEPALKIPPEVLADLSPEQRQAVQQAIGEMAARMRGEFVPRRDGNRAAEKAEELLHRARGAAPQQQRLLARQALDLWPDCADAYVLLGDHARNMDEAISCYEQGVAAGRRALGETFDQLRGHFWMAWETRPYMTARFLLADALRAAGRREEAAGHFEEMLRLNPNDNQGIREHLLAAYLDLRRPAAAAELLERFEDEPTASWAYGRALLAFQTQGECPASNQQLAAARKVNKHLPAYLLGDKPLPDEGPAFVGIGDVNEAVAAAQLFLPAWKATPGAVSWLRAQVTASKSPPRPDQAPSPADPSEADLHALKAAPLAPGEVWQIDARRLPTWVREGRRTLRPWAVFVLDATHEYILNHEMLLERPAPHALWKAASTAMVKPKHGSPHRPEAVEVCSTEAHIALRAGLDAIGVRCVVRDDLAFLDQVLEDYSRSTQREERVPALVDSAGLSSPQLASFFEAAAAYYRLAPWRRVPPDTIIEVAAPMLADAPWYAVVMGQGGMQLGLALYQDLQLLRSMLHGNLSDREVAWRSSSISLMYGEDFEMPIRDLDAIERFGWDVAGPEAFPAVVRIQPRMRFTAVSPRELEMVEACLRAIPPHLASHTPAVEVATISGASAVRLRLLP